MDDDNLITNFDLPNPDQISYSLVLKSLPPRIRQRILNPPTTNDEDRDRNIYYVIKSLQKLDLSNHEIKPLLSNYKISHGRDLDEDIKRVQEGNPSENQLSRRFSELYKDKLSYCSDWEKWLWWNGNYWEVTKHLAVEFIRQTLEQSDMPEFRRKASTVKGIEYLVQSDPDLISYNKDWNNNHWLLTTPNGTINLKTGKPTISYQSNMITKTTSVESKPIPTPLWFKFLLQATNKNKDYIRYLQRVMGYCLTGSIKEHALFFLHGSGGNGKGVFLNTITSILGDYAVSAPLGMFIENKFEGHPTELAMLCGARLVTAQEVQEGKAWNEVKIKALTGGDPITGRFMNKDFFTFEPNFKLLIAGNHEPQLRSVDDATIRRFNKLPFIHKPDANKIDKNLLEKLKPEYPGILQWMINGCLSWQQIGLSPPEIVQLSTKKYFGDQNSFQQFLDDECEIDKTNKTFGYGSIPLFKAWCTWASHNHVRQGNISMFRETLEKQGFTPIRHIPNERGVRGFLGIKLKLESIETNTSTPRSLTQEELEGYEKRKSDDG